MRKSLLDVLFPKLRQAVLSAFLLNPDKWWYLSDLANHLDVTPSSLQRELASLTKVQALETRKEGNRIYYKANVSLPGLRDIQALLIKTAGIADVVKAALKGVLNHTDASFIYGSLARGEEVATSDVDVMIIGDSKLLEIVTVLKKAEASIGRAINPTVYTKKEFIQKAKGDNAFIKTVLKNEKIFLKGSENELEALVG